MIGGKKQRTDRNVLFGRFCTAKSFAEEDRKSNRKEWLLLYSNHMQSGNWIISGNIICTPNISSFS